jgi:hypothetical protein
MTGYGFSFDVGQNVPDALGTGQYLERKARFLHKPGQMKKN